MGEALQHHAQDLQVFWVQKPKISTSGSSFLQIFLNPSWVIQFCNGPLETTRPAEDLANTLAW